jgi:hypothetical protein
MPVDACDVGSRVVVRSRLGGRGPGGGPAVTDVVGLLEQVDDEAITVRRRDGVVTRIPMADVVAAKRISRVAPRAGGRGLRVEPEELQRITDSGWPAPCATPRRMLAACSAGGSPAGEPVSVHGEPGRLATPLRCELVTDFYAAAELPAMGAGGWFRQQWERSFDAAGWTPSPARHAGASWVGGLRAHGAARGGSQPTRVRALVDRSPDDWLALTTGPRQTVRGRARCARRTRSSRVRAVGEPLAR